MMLIPRVGLGLREGTCIGRRGREAEGGGLLNRYTGLNLYRGFESLRLREDQKGQTRLNVDPAFAPARMPRWFNRV